MNRNGESLMNSSTTPVFLNSSSKAETTTGTRRKERVISLAGLRISSSDLNDIVERYVEFVRFILVHGEMDVTMDRVYPNDKMLRYTTYYISQKTPEKTTVKELYEIISLIGNEEREDFISEVSIQELEWLYKFRDTVKTSGLKSYLERVMPYTMSYYLRRNRKQGFLLISKESEVPSFSSTLISSIRQYDDVRKSIIEFGTEISGKTVTEMAANLGITYRAARYIMTRSNQ